MMIARQGGCDAGSARGRRSVDQDELYRRFLDWYLENRGRFHDCAFTMEAVAHAAYLAGYGAARNEIDRAMPILGEQADAPLPEMVE